MAESFKRPPEIPVIPCVSIAETVAEKFVALTRRAGAEFAGAGGPRDSTLVRHVYDLHVLRAHYDPAAVVTLAQTIMRADAEAYGRQFAAYREDPLRETVRAARLMATDTVFSGRYAKFQRDMVYDEGIEFETAVATITSLACLL
jgi:hypothetical protein